MLESMSELYVYTTPLHEAIRINNSKEIQLLLKNNRYIFEKDDEDITPLELAQILKNDDVIALLEKATTQSHNQMTAK